MSKEPKKAIIVFVKNFIHGSVKTRLASTLGDDRALEIYKAMVQRISDVLKELPAEEWKICVYFSEYIDIHSIRWPNKAEFYIQSTGDVGDRMCAALREQVTKQETTILIGTDLPNLSSSIICSAGRLLKHNDIVLGPTLDGGYYLIGVRGNYPELFQNIPWSTSEVYSCTANRILSLGMTYDTVEKLSDVDYEEDWIRYGWNID